MVSFGSRWSSRSVAMCDGTHHSSDAICAVGFCHGDVLLMKQVFERASSCGVHLAGSKTEASKTPPPRTSRGGL